MKALVFILCLGLWFGPPTFAFATNWHSSENWRILSWDISRNMRTGFNVADVIIEFVGFGNSGFLRDVKVCGYDAKRGKSACRRIDYGRVSKATAVQLKVKIGFTKYPIYKVYLMEKD